MVEKQATSSHFDLIYGESLLPVLQGLTKTGTHAANKSAKVRDKPLRRPDNYALNPHGAGKGRSGEEEKKGEVDRT